MPDRSITITVDGISATLVAHGAQVDEAIETAFTARVRVIAYVSDTRAPAVPLGLIGKKATVKLHFHDVERTFIGLVDAVEDEETQSFITVMARIGWLGDPRDYRVFVKQSAKEIATTVLTEHGLTLDWKANRNAPMREQCVQSFESDLGFVSRILAEEGVCWYPSPSDGKTITAADTNGTFSELSLNLNYREDAGLETERAVIGARLDKTIASDNATVRDYDFTHPQLELVGTAGSGALEWYEFPGTFSDEGSGDDVAAIRLAERRAEELTVHGGSTAPELTAGGVFALNEAPLAGLNGNWLVVSVAHHADLTGNPDSVGYQCHFRAVPAASGYRPQRPATHPRKGVTTAVVSGASGKELHLDEHGRMLALLRWERRAAADDKASTELRVMQPQLPGSIFNPRVTWEQLVSHSDPDAELPVALGRIYNGAQRPPASLPREKVQTHIGTWSTPNGGKGNYAKIDDSAGKERLLRNASNNFSEKTENDKVRKVGVNETRQVAAKRAHVIKEVKQTRVDGAHTINVAAVRTVSVGSNFQITSANEIIVVGAARAIRVGGDFVTATPTMFRIVGGSKGEAAIEHHNITTQGGIVIGVRGSMNVRVALGEGITVGGVSIVKVSGAKNITSTGYQLKVRGVYLETFSNLNAKAGSDIGDNFRALSMSARATSLKGSDVAITADVKLTIKAGGCTVTMTPGSIHIDGGFEGWTPSFEGGDHKYG